MSDATDGWTRRHKGTLITAMAELVHDRKEWQGVAGELPPDVWYAYSLVITRSKQVFPGGTCTAPSREVALEGAIGSAVRKIDEALAVVGQ